MGNAEDLKPSGDKIRCALRWICEELAAHPDKKRNNVILDAEVRFDLSPLECQFLQDKLIEKE